MTDRPILFSAPMVRAILEGRKTVTRRLVKPQPPKDHEIVASNFHPTIVDRKGEEQPGAETFGAYTCNGDWAIRCPYGQPGDQLWVKETFLAWGRWETRYSEKKGRDEWHFIDMTLDGGKEYHYHADAYDVVAMARRSDGGVSPAWWNRPAIFMPRIASRIALEVTGVRVERLQDISEHDAAAEGLERANRLWWLTANDGPPFGTAGAAFRYLWEKINGLESWNANPWVWVVEFKRVKP